MVQQLRNKLPRCAAALLAACTAAAFAGPPMYHIKKIKPDETGEMETRSATSINNDGIVVGDAGIWNVGYVYYVLDGRRPRALTTPVDMAGGNPHINIHRVVVGDVYPEAYMWDSNGQATNLAPLIPCDGTRFSAATGINDLDEIVGNYTCNVGHDRTQGSWLYRNGTMTDLGNLGAKGNFAAAINNVGQVVGRSSLMVHGEKVEHAYLWQDGVIKDLGTLGEDHSYAVAVNDAGHVVGVAYSSGVDQRKAFSYRNGHMQEMTTCAGNVVTPKAINNHGQVVGLFSVRRTATGVLVQEGQCYFLSALLDDSGEGWHDLILEDINDDGVIVGEGNKGRFIATPLK